MSRLILIEGMIGAGKTTIATRIAEWLAAEGEDARAYLEFDDDHPIRTEVVDRLRGAPVAHDPGAYAVEQWGALAERCRRDRRTVILEAAFLQNSVIPIFMRDAPLEEVRAAFSRIAALVAPATPLLIYLRPSDTERAVRRVHDERGELSAARNVAAVSACPWAMRRSVAGREAVVALYRAWEHVVDELLDGWSFPKLLLVDPQDDWDGALERIRTTVRGERR